MYLLYQARIAQLNRQKLALDALVERRTENIRQLAQAGQDITSSLDLESVLAAVYTRVREFMDTPVFVIGILDEDSGEICSLFHYENGERAAQFRRDLADRASPAAWCLRNRLALCVSDEQELRKASEELRFSPREQPVQSAVFYPLMSGDRAGGFLSVQSFRKSAYGENELQMLRTIAAYAAVAIDNAESHRKLSLAKAEIERVSLSDQLTGLQNRRFLQQLIPGETNRVQRIVAEGGTEKLGIVLIDIDHFKQVNDAHGHDAGDRVLVQLAQILRSTCRESDWAVRLGGEEFLVVARVSDQAQLLHLAERIRQNVEHHTFAISADLSLRKSCSIGVSQYPFVAEAAASISWEQSVNFADQALYMAKHSGRNKWIAVFEQEIPEPGSFYASASADLQAAADKGLITLYNSSEYQSGAEHRSAAG